MNQLRNVILLFFVCLLHVAESHSAMATDDKSNSGGKRSGTALTRDAAGQGEDDSKTAAGERNQPAKNRSRSKSTDLISLVDIGRDAVSGAWELEKGVLKAPVTDWNSLLQVKHPLPVEYDLIFQIVRSEGKYGFIFTPVVGGVPIAVYIDGAEGSGIHGIDGKNYYEDRTSFKGQLFRNGKLSTIRCEIRMDSIRVRCDKRLIINWKGSPSQLEMPAEYNHPDNQMIAVGSHKSLYLIRRMILVDRTKNRSRGR